MILEQVLENAAYARPGFSLVSFKEAALPNYLLTTRLLALEKKSLGPIEEACLGAVSAGLGDPEDVSAFLGLPRVVLNGVFAGLNTTECINYSRSDATGAIVSLTEKGRTTLSTLREVVPQESVVKFVFDPYEQKIRFISTSSLFKPREIKERGWYEVPLCGAKRPEVQDIPLADIDKVLQKLPRRDEGSRELLAIRRIERREMHFLPCIMLFYRSLSSDEVQVAFYLDDGFSLGHENAFRELGGPELAGANHALATPDIPRLDDLISGVSEKQKMEELLALEHEFAIQPNGEKLLGAVASAEQEPTDENGQEMLAATSSKAIVRLKAMTQRCIRMHEHPGLLRKALTVTQNRLLIVSPWITHHVIDSNFIYSLEALLRNGVDVTIGYGLADEDGARGTDKAKQKPTITDQAEKDLSSIQKRFDNFKLVFLGNTHRKLLVSDGRFAVVTSFNWLSFRGDPSKKARDEFGYLVTEPEDIDSIYNDGMGLISQGYSYPVKHVSRRV